MAELLFIVPAYNEETSLPGALADLRQHRPDAAVVVVNDGSTDRTAAVARAHGAILLDLPINMGISGAVQAGLLHAVPQGYQVAVQFDGDGQHRVDQVEALLAPLLRGECDVAIGSRFLQPGHYRTPFPRRCGIAIFRLVNSLLLGQAIHDNTSGFRAYNRAALTFLAADYPDDYPEPESVVTLVRNGFRIHEVPTLMRERQGGRSSITFARAIFCIGEVLFAILIGATRFKTRREGDEPAHPVHLSPR